MSSRIFLQTLQNKLKGGNLRSIYLNGLPGRLVGRLDVKQLDHVTEGLAHSFLSALLSTPSFEFRVSFDEIDLNQVPQDVQKKLGVISKRLNAIGIDNEDFFKEHGTKTLGFGYPLLIRRSTKDPEKVIKAPLFIWPLELVKSKNKVNEWILLRNKVMQENGRIVESDVHPIGMNQVLTSFIKSEDDVALPGLPSEMLEDSLLDQDELIAACARVLEALNSGSKEEQERALRANFLGLVSPMPEQQQVDSLSQPVKCLYPLFGCFWDCFAPRTKAHHYGYLKNCWNVLTEFQFDALAVGNLLEFSL